MKDLNALVFMYEYFVNFTSGTTEGYKDNDGYPQHYRSFRSDR